MSNESACCSATGRPARNSEDQTAEITDPQTGTSSTVSQLSVNSSSRSLALIGRNSVNQGVIVPFAGSCWLRHEGRSGG